MKRINFRVRGRSFGNVHCIERQSVGFCHDRRLLVFCYDLEPLIQFLPLLKEANCENEFCPVGNNCRHFGRLHSSVMLHPLLKHNKPSQTFMKVMPSRARTSVRFNCASRPMATHFKNLARLGRTRRGCCAYRAT